MHTVKWLNTRVHDTTAENSALLPECSHERQDWVKALDGALLRATPHFAYSAVVGDRPDNASICLHGDESQQIVVWHPEMCTPDAHHDLQPSRQICLLFLIIVKHIMFEEDHRGCSVIAVCSLAKLDKARLDVLASPA